MNTTTAVATIIKALGRSVRGTYVPYRWTYSNSAGTELIEHVMGKGTSEIIYTKYSKFLFIKIGTERFTLSNSDKNISTTQWYDIIDAIHNANVRLKAF